MSASDALAKIVAAKDAPASDRRLGAATAMKVLMATPGASTDDPEFLKHLAKLSGIPPKETKTKEVQMKESAQDLDDKVALEAGLADLAADLTAHFLSAGANADGINTCSLTGPESLTVTTEGRGYSKLPHLGGEEFIPDTAYLGKRGKVIVCFKPRDAAAYSTMEMPIEEALVKLDGFSIIANDLEGPPLMERLKGLKREESKLREQEKMKDKFVEYADIGFGSF